MKNTRLLAFVLALFTAAQAEAPPAAPAPADTLARFANTYDTELKKLTDKREADLATLRQQYLGSLKKLELSEQSAGKLAPLLAIREEIARFEKEQVVSEFNLRTDAEPVSTRQNVYLQRDGAIWLEFAKGAVLLTDKLVAALDKMQTDLTRQNQIDAALAAREFKDKTRARTEVASAYDLVELFRKAEEAEKAEMTATAQIAATQPPAPPAAVKPGVAETPERGERGRDMARIRERFSDFVEAISEDQFAKAAEIVDPEQSRKLGEFLLHAYFNAFKPWFRIAREHKVKIEADKVRIEDDGKTAQSFPRIKSEWGREGGRPTDWVKREGEWYIIFKDQPEEKRPLRPGFRPDRR